MDNNVVLSVRGRQRYADQEPEEIELVTEGVLEQDGTAWKLSYEESELTGLQGVSTTFLIDQKNVTLKRTGRLNSQMVFQEGVAYDSLYQMEFGTMMLTVCATKVEVDLTPEGGTIDLKYKIEVEQNAAGMIEYHLDVRKK